MFIDGVDRTNDVSGDLNNWEAIKTITFDDTATTIAVFGGDGEGGCSNGGFAMKCTSSHPDWNGLETDTSWKVLGNNGNQDVATSCPAGWADPSFDDSSWANALPGSDHAESVVGVTDICGDETSWCFRKHVKTGKKIKSIQNLNIN